MNFIAILVFLLASGVFGMLHRMRIEDIGKSFHRFVTLHYLVWMTIVLVTMRPDQWYVWLQFSLVLLAAVLGFSYFFAVNRASVPTRQKLYWVGVAVLLGILLSLSFHTPFPELIEPFVPPVLVFFHLVASAAIVGAILDGMMCGHWYLVNTDMNLRPIRSISRSFSGALIVKILLVGATLVWTFWHEPYLYRQLVQFFPILFWVRLLVGLGGGLLFNWMSWQALKYENTQAATGILYGCIVWVILGEFSGLYLMLQTGIPL